MIILNCFGLLHSYRTRHILTDNKIYCLQIHENSDGARDFRAMGSETISENENVKSFEKKRIFMWQCFKVKSLCSSDTYF